VGLRETQSQLHGVTEITTMKNQLQVCIRSLVDLIYKMSCSDMSEFF